MREAFRPIGGVPAVVLVSPLYRGIVISYRNTRTVWDERTRDAQQREYVLERDYSDVPEILEVNLVLVHADEAPGRNMRRRVARERVRVLACGRVRGVGVGDHGSRSRVGRVVGEDSELDWLMSVAGGADIP